MKTSVPAANTATPAPIASIPNAANNSKDNLQSSFTDSQPRSTKFNTDKPTAICPLKDTDLQEISTWLELEDDKGSSIITW